MENIVEVKTLRQAYQLRRIRNECREYMTQDTSKIGYIRQFKWFYNVYLPQYRMHATVAYLLYRGGEAIGYGLIRGCLSEPTISGGLDLNYRGMGYGKILFTFLTDKASTVKRVGDRSVFLEVLGTNEKAFKLYESLGYVIKDSKNGIIYMQKDYGEFDR